MQSGFAKSSSSDRSQELKQVENALDAFEKASRESAVALQKLASSMETLSSSLKSVFANRDYARDLTYHAQEAAATMRRFREGRAYEAYNRTYHQCVSTRIARLRVRIKELHHSRKARKEAMKKKASVKPSDAGKHSHCTEVARSMDEVHQRAYVALCEEVNTQGPALLQGAYETHAAYLVDVCNALRTAGRLGVPLQVEITPLTQLETEGSVATRPHTPMSRRAPSPHGPLPPPPSSSSPQRHESGPAVINPFTAPMRAQTMGNGAYTEFQMYTFSQGVTARDQ